MKNTIQKILITLVGLVVSFAACVLGMYMVFLADKMKFSYQMLFSAIFMFNPITTILMAVNMFKRPKTGAPAAEKRPKDEVIKEPKKPKEIRNPFKKEKAGADSSKKDADLSDSYLTDRDTYTEDSFSLSDNEFPYAEKDDDLFASHVSADKEDQSISD